MTYGPKEGQMREMVGYREAPHQKIGSLLVGLKRSVCLISGDADLLASCESKTANIMLDKVKEFNIYNEVTKPCSKCGRTGCLGRSEGGCVNYRKFSTCRNIKAIRNTYNLYVSHKYFLTIFNANYIC